MISNMVSVRRLGTMAQQSTQGSFTRARSKARASLNGMTVVTMREISSKASLRALASTISLILTKYTRVSLEIVIWRAEASKCGTMAASMMENLKMARRMEKVRLSGQMETNT